MRESVYFIFWVYFLRVQGETYERRVRLKKCFRHKGLGRSKSLLISPPKGVFFFLFHKEFIFASDGRMV